MPNTPTSLSYRCHNSQLLDWVGKMCKTGVQLCWWNLSICCIFAVMVAAVDIQTILSNTAGYRLDKDPTYLVTVPRKIRPNQVIQVFASILYLEYPQIIVQVSVVRENIEYASTKMKFDRPSSRMMQLQMPQNALPGVYRVRLEGTVSEEDTGNIFSNETDLLFESKQASVFIQLSKPVYRQGQTVHFRVVPILPNLMPHYGSLTIYVRDPTGFSVRRWLGQQTNAGGIVNQSFVISDQPRYGNWSISVEAFGYEYNEYFRVEEFWEPRFDVNVSLPVYIMDDVDAIHGVIMSNHTSGKATIGDATVVLTIVPPNTNYYYNRPNNNLPTITKKFDYFNGRIDFSISMEDMLAKQEGVRHTGTLAGSELVFNVTVRDWYLDMVRNGSASTTCLSSDIKLKWVGDSSRTFKPDTLMSVTVAVMKTDGTPVVNPDLVVSLKYKIRTIAGSVFDRPGESKVPLNGFATFNIYADKMAEMLIIKASADNKVIEMRAFRYFSPSKSYVSVLTSTKNPKVNEYMVFHVKATSFIPKVYYQVVSKGNILIGDELDMGSSRQKTFSVALSRDMVPTARIIVYYIRMADQEVVADALNFFVNGTRLNPVTARFNRGKDFSRETIEINAWADAGSYVAFQAIPYDLYIRGISSGLTENKLIDELYTYDEPANSSYRHLWRISETDYEYKFFSANGYGADALSTFLSAGLLVLSDANVTEVPHTCTSKQGVCFDGSCFDPAERCNGRFACQDGADEQGCTYEENKKKIADIDRVSRVMRFYDESSWIWKEYFVKPDGRVDFRVKTPKYPLTWVMHGLSVSRENGLGLMQSPIMYDAARYMYIQVEAPEYVVRGEQIGFRITVFNHWYTDDYIEVLVTAHDSGNHAFVLVEEFGIVSSYRPRTTTGDQQTIVFLEPGESKDIYMPILPLMQSGCLEITISASCFMERDSVTRRMCVKSDGVTNYYHIPYLIDLITKASILVPDLDVPVDEYYVTPEVREHKYVPGSPKGIPSIFGDVVTPGFFEDYLTAENIMYRPYGGAEQNMFNFAYNLITLKFKKASMQLSDEELQTALHYMNIALQRQLSYMNDDGSFGMFRDFNRSSIWLTAFVAKYLYGARFGEWERDLFIPLELINKIVIWICKQQNESGAFLTEGYVYDRKMSTKLSRQEGRMLTDPISLTAYVLIALHGMSDVSGLASSCVETTRQRAAIYLGRNINNLNDDDTLQLAITAYALSLSQEKSATAFKRLWRLKRRGEELYFADQEVPPNPSEIITTVRYLKPRIELVNDGYAVQTTAYALMAHIKHGQFKSDRDSMMRWLQSMRNYIGGFASTQDTITAMEALYEYTQVDPNRNVFNMIMQLESTANPSWKRRVIMNKFNYTHLEKFSLTPSVWGAIKMKAEGTGRAMLQLTTEKNVEYPHLLKAPDQESFEISTENAKWSGRNYSRMEVVTCVRWTLLERSQVSGLAVLEIDIPSGFIIMNDSLREYVQSKIVPNLRRSEFYGRKVVFYFDYLDTSKTCVYFKAERWFPVANATIQHRIRVFDYYEPGLYKTSMYTTYQLFSLNICYVCGSYQCPYCPQFNVATAIKASFTLVTLLLGIALRQYCART